MKIFVYGTLKPGFHNYDFYLKGRTLSEVPGFLSGYDMYSVRGSFPAIAENDNHHDLVHGVVVEIDDNDFDTLFLLDGLEGYRQYHPKSSMYLRVPVRVATDDGLVEAFTYVWNRETKGLPRIPSGVWQDKALAH